MHRRNLVHQATPQPLLNRRSAARRSAWKQAGRENLHHIAGLVDVDFRPLQQIHPLATAPLVMSHDLRSLPLLVHSLAHPNDNLRRIHVKALILLRRASMTSVLNVVVLTQRGTTLKVGWLFALRRHLTYAGLTQSIHLELLKIADNLRVNRLMGHHLGRLTLVLKYSTHAVGNVAFENLRANLYRNPRVRKKVVRFLNLIQESIDFNLYPVDIFGDSGSPEPNRRATPLENRKREPVFIPLLLKQHGAAQ